jgi:hypothetical protein
VGIGVVVGVVVGTGVSVIVWAGWVAVRSAGADPVTAWQAVPTSPISRKAISKNPLRIL